MTSILIVDRDSNACRKLASELAAIRPIWRIHTATSGQQALSSVQEPPDGHTVDVIVSETQLGDMNGFSLLDQLRSLAPQSIRFTLSEDTSTEVVLENTRANQRFLHKPLSTAHLATIIERSVRLQQILNDQPLQQYMGSIKSVPALPAIYDEMLQELAAPHSSLIKVGSIVERDAGLTITVLKIVNSAFYGLNRRVESVGQAVTLLGVHLIKNITLTTQVFSRFKGSQLSARRLSQLNDEAMRIGALCNQFARFAKVPRSTVDHCQIAGMMANVGELITTVKSESARIDENTALSTELIGAALLNTWMMPDAVVEAVALQHESPPRNVDKVSPLVVLHSIRHLQSHYVQVPDEEQRSTCVDYLSTYLPQEMADTWLDAFEAIEQLTASQNTRAA